MQHLTEYYRSQLGMPRRFASVQFVVPEWVSSVLDRVRASIHEGHSLNGGRQFNHPHVTVKYGLQTNSVFYVQRLVRDFGPVHAEIGKLSYFKSRGFEILKCDILGDDIHRLNRLISDEMPSGDFYQKYAPHITVAYMRPNTARFRSGRFSLTGKPITFDTLDFYGKDRFVTRIPLTTR